MESAPITTTDPPVEIAARIVSFLSDQSTVDRVSVRAAAALSPNLKAAALAQLYGQLDLDLYAAGSDAELFHFATEVINHPDSALFVRGLVFGDNGEGVIDDPECPQHILAVDLHHLPAFALSNTPNLGALTIASTSKPLDWRKFSPEVQLSLTILFNKHQLTELSLVGLRNIPLQLAASIFKTESLHLENSQFTDPTSLEALFMPSPVPPPASSHTSTPYGSLSFTSAWEGPSNIPYFRTLPPIRHLSLSISGARPRTSQALEAAALLKLAGPRVRELAISTTGFMLSFVKQQPPPNPHLDAQPYKPGGRFQRLHPHDDLDCFQIEGEAIDFGLVSPTMSTPPALPIVADNDAHNPTSTGSWFADLMMPLTRTISEGRLNPNVDSLKISVSHWRYAQQTKENGELFWAVTLLGAVPPVHAAHIRDITLAVRVGTDSCAENPEAIEDCFEWKGWSALDAVLAADLRSCAGKWICLDKVRVEVQSKFQCIAASYPLQHMLASGLKKLMNEDLKMLNRKKGVILEVDYVETTD